jgi:6-pyruvoyltetrahydropterin/6-carboxytetrahydropterin synthase
MYELKILTQFAAAHQLREHGGACERLHGHNWKIEVYVTSPDVGKDGLVVDFRRMKEGTRKALEELDHKFLNEIEPFRTVNPSSENIARYLYETLSRELNEDAVRVSKVTAWESDTACASYVEP